jgi:hypothetical protein
MDSDSDHDPGIVTDSPEITTENASASDRDRPGHDAAIFQVQLQVQVRPSIITDDSDGSPSAGRPAGRSARGPGSGAAAAAAEPENPTVVVSE